MRNKTELAPAERFSAGGFLTVDEFAALHNLGRVTVYREIRRGRLRSTKVGKCTRIAAEDVAEWRAALRAELNGKTCDL